MKSYFRLPITVLLAVSALASCNSLEVTMPVGPRGEQGVQGLPGKDGLSAYELWVKAVQEKSIDYSGPVDINHFFLYLKGKDGVDGKDGKDGKDGSDGKSAYEVWLEYVASGVEDPHNPGTNWDKSRTSMADFYWFLTGNNGDDGLIPYIKDGNWWIGDSDTGVKARGDKGDRGDTGAAGKDGADGLSAYEMWKDYVRETISAGGTVTDGNGNEVTLDDLSLQRFFQYLTGRTGDKGDPGQDGKDGSDGKDGTDGKDGSDGKDGRDGKDGVDGKDGADGRDGSTPYVGDNGNWWIGGIDTGVKAQGPKGDPGVDGKDGVAGKDGVDGKDGIDGKDGVDGKDGKDGVNGENGRDGKSAYDLWVEDVKSPSGLDDPKNPGTKWDPSKVSVADFYEYLKGAAGADGNPGADGKDGIDGGNGQDGQKGTDGKSAYELWKELVLSDEGVENPGNGVYDLEAYPKWPRSAVSEKDFFEYLRGGDGEPGGKLAATDTLYVEEADWTKYNVAPVRALAKVRMNGAVKDTTYEYVNPYSGGCAMIVTGPGPVVIPDCTVKFKDQTGRSYTLKSDALGYIYINRADLPVWNEGSPSMADLAARTRPESFSFGGKVIDDPARIASTCGVPYQVGLSVRMTGASWSDDRLSADYQATRTVEGKVETGWGGKNYPDSDDNGLGYFYYRSLGDLRNFRKYTFGANSFVRQPNDYCQGDHFIQFKAKSAENLWQRPVGTTPSEEMVNVVFGDGEKPSVVGVNHIPVSVSGSSARYLDFIPDYGLRCVSETKAVNPEYCLFGAFNVSGLKGGDGDAAFTSNNGKLVWSEDKAEKVAVNKTNYELILGQTSFSFSFDYSTFGHVYHKKAYYDESTDTFRFKRYDSFLDYLDAVKPTATQSDVTTFIISGRLGGVSIRNTVGISLYVNNGVLKGSSVESVTIRNLYDRFDLQFAQFRFRDAYYGTTKGEFRYSESNPYVATCELDGKKYVFQAIKDGVSAPLP